MFKQVLTTSIIGIGLLFTGTAAAHNNNTHHNHHNYHKPAQHCVSGQKINNRQWNQKRRIKRGIRKGQLVGWEATQLKRQQRRIRKAERRMRKSDHCLTRNEARRLLNRLDRASRKIHKLKNNHVRRGHRGHHRNNRRNNRH